MLSATMKLQIAAMTGPFPSLDSTATPGHATKLVDKVTPGSVLSPLAAAAPNNEQTSEPQSQAQTLTDTSFLSSASNNELMANPQKQAQVKRGPSIPAKTTLPAINNTACVTNTTNPVNELPPGSVLNPIVVPSP